jgi:hypothetical protein
MRLNLIAIVMLACAASAAHAQERTWWVKMTDYMDGAVASYAIDGNNNVVSMSFINTNPIQKLGRVDKVFGPQSC